MYMKMRTISSSRKHGECLRVKVSKSVRSLTSITGSLFFHVMSCILFIPLSTKKHKTTAVAGEESRANKTNTHPSTRDTHAQANAGQKHKSQFVPLSAGILNDLATLNTKPTHEALNQHSWAMLGQGGSIVCMQMCTAANPAF